MEREELLKRAKAALRDAFGERLQGVVLYGSEARGEAGPNSDVDLLVLLDRVDHYAADLRTGLSALYSLSSELERHVSIMLAPSAEYETVECPLYQAAHREGIPA